MIKNGGVEMKKEFKIIFNIIAISGLLGWIGAILAYCIDMPLWLIYVCCGIALPFPIIMLISWINEIIQKHKNKKKRYEMTATITNGKTKQIEKEITKYYDKCDISKFFEDIGEVTIIENMEIELKVIEIIEEPK